MAISRIYVSGNDVEKRRLDGGRYTAHYEIKRSRMAVSWNGKKTIERVRPGEVYLIHYGEGRPTIQLMTPPHRRDDFIMWLLGFANATRMHDNRGYCGTLCKRRLEFPHALEREHSESGQYWKMTWFRTASDNDIRLAAYIDHRLNCDKDVAMQILRQCRQYICFPQEYLYKILAKTFDMTHDEVNCILAPTSIR